MRDGRLALAKWTDEVAHADLTPGAAAKMLSTLSRTGSAKALKPRASSAASAASRGAARTEHSTKWCL